MRQTFYDLGMISELFRLPLGETDSAICELKGSQFDKSISLDGLGRRWCALDGCFSFI
jgi:hypothetical protein